MNRRRTLLGLGLIGPFVATAALVLLIQRGDSQVPAAFGWVRHTQKVQLALSNVLSLVREAEVSQRSFIITHDSAALARYHVLADSAPKALAHVRELVADNPAQVARADTLDAFLRRRLAILTAVAELARDGRRDSAFAVVRTLRGAALMDSVRAAAGRALAEEERLLAEREATLARQLHARRLLGYGLLAGSAALVVLVLLALRAWRRQQRLVTICAWSRVIQHQNEWITFEEYLKRQFNVDVSHGIAPEAEQMLVTAEFPVRSPGVKPEG